MIRLQSRNRKVNLQLLSFSRDKAMTLTLQQFGIDQLDSNQRLELISLIWDSIPDDAGFVPPAWHLELLEKRIAAADASPDEVEDWESVRKRLLTSSETP